MSTANYFITGVWFTNNRVISEVYLHATYNQEKNFWQGVKTSEADVIKLIKSGNVVKTLVWNYTAATWRVGAAVTIVREGQNEFCEREVIAL